MKVLIYTHEYPPFAGGAGIYSRDLATGLAESGAEVHVATLRPPGQQVAGAPSGTSRVIVHPMAPWETHVPWAHYFLLRLDWRHRFDALLVTERAAQENVARLRHPWFPYLAVVHGTEVLDCFGGKRVYAELDPDRMAEVYERAETCLAGTAATARMAQRLLERWGIRFETVLYGIDPGRLGRPDPDAVRRMRAAYGDAAEIVFCLARLDLDKGHDVLLRAFSEVLRARPNARLLIGGEGPLKASLAELGRELSLGDRVEFLGKIPPDELPNWFSLCDVFAMPSKCERRWEGFGLVFLEANFYGKPVVGGNEGGVPEAIADGESGLVVDPRDPHAVAAAIVRLLEDPELRRRLGEGGRKRLFDGFAARRMAEETRQWIQRAVEKQRPIDRLRHRACRIGWSAAYLFDAAVQRLRRSMT